MLMPPDLRDWLPENHIARFIVELVERFGVSSFIVNNRGTGSEQYPPSMLAALLIYCYATGRFESRRIEEATYSDSETTQRTEATRAQTEASARDSAGKPAV